MVAYAIRPPWPGHGPLDGLLDSAAMLLTTNGRENYHIGRMRIASRLAICSIADSQDRTSEHCMLASRCQCIDVAAFCR